jgi:hypothetical protein
LQLAKKNVSAYIVTKPAWWLSRSGMYQPDKTAMKMVMSMKPPNWMGLRPRRSTKKTVNQ